MELIPASSSVGTSSDPQVALHGALRDFQSILTDGERGRLGKLGSVRGADTVMIFTLQLDRENQLRKGRAIAGKVYSVLQCVQAFSTVVETFVSSHPDVAALVWGSIKLTMLLAVNYTSYFETISAIFMAFSKQCPRFSEYQALYPTSARLRKALCDFNASIIHCCKHVIEVIRRPWTQQLQNALFQSLEKEFQPFVQDIQKLGKEVKDEVASATALANYQDQKLQAIERKAASKNRSRLRAFVPTVENDLDEIKEMSRQQSTRRSREEKQRLLDWLSSHDYRRPFSEACKKRHCGTAEWICEAPEFIHWRTGTGPPLLWCSGKIGSGKTILCANVINHVFLTKNRNTRVSFFFVDRDNTDSLRAETMIRSIIRQSLDFEAEPAYVEKQLRTLERAPFVTPETWVNLLRHVVQQSTVHFILIDGLDECDAAERRNLLDALSSITATTSHLRTFIASRASVSIDLRSRPLPMEHISMAGDRLASDIRAYIDASIQERVQNEELVFGDPHLIIEVNDTLTQHADGMFLWVAFLINEICGGSCDDDIRRSLCNLPKNLEETFTRILSRVSSQTQRIKLVRKVFRWVAAAKQPLVLEELQEAVSIDIGQRNSRPERRVHNMDRIVVWCGNLLQITEEAPTHVQFAHSSIRDFLTGSLLPARLEAFHVDPEEADHFAGEICVTYLCFSDFITTMARRQLQINPVALAGTALSPGVKVAHLSTAVVEIALKHSKVKADSDLGRDPTTFVKTKTEKDMEKFRQSHPFLEYAAKHWITHTTRFRKKRSSTWDLWLHIVMDTSGLASRPWRNLSSRRIRHALLAWSHQTHHYALLRHALGELRMYETKIDKLAEKSAVAADDEEVAILLDSGKCSMTCINNALQRASNAGCIEVVERLLSAKADVNAAAAKQYGRTALQAACEGGHLEVVERLLHAKADVNAPAAEYNGRTALQAACEKGHLEVVERLLSAKAYVNAAATKAVGRTALQAACEGGHLEVVERLLGAKADVNAAATDFTARTALQAACAGGHLEVVERLLSAEADVNAAAANFSGRTALQAACEKGHLEVVERLLGAKADVNAAAANSSGRTALQAACEKGHLEVVERLLGAKADVNAAAANSSGRTALQAACEKGHLEVVERLLGAKADVNASAAEYTGRTALQAACGGGHLEVVERLLGAKADINAAGATKSSGRTALQAACGGGHLEVVERLLGAKADVNAAAATKSSGRTALQAACEGGHLEVVERLLSAKADVNAAAANSSGRTALQAACEGGHLEVVERLLGAKADVNAAAANFSGRTALQAACEKGHLEVVERLLGAKADVNAFAATKSSGRTALQAACEGGHLEVVERLLSAKADVNASAAEYTGRTALQLACGGGHLEVVERLLGAKADVNAAATKVVGRTALQAACEGGHLEVVERLLGAEAYVNAADSSGRTALRAACEGGHLEVVERLLGAKADVNAATQLYGRTALQAAGEGGFLEIVELLVKAGAKT